MQNILKLLILLVFKPNRIKQIFSPMCGTKGIYVSVSIS